MPTSRTLQDQQLMPRISACRTARTRKQSRTEKSTVSMVWEGYRSRLCKCTNLNENGLFSRDNWFQPHFPVP
jgi:hypothetical protein